MQFRTITLILILPATWPEHWQPKLGIIRHCRLIVSLSFSHGLRLSGTSHDTHVELSLLTFVRSSELRFARWDEFDFDKACWRIPAQREEIKGVRYSHRGMKMKEEHIVPLSRQALVLLEKLRTLSGETSGCFPAIMTPIKS